MCLGDSYIINCPGKSKPQKGIQIIEDFIKTYKGDTKNKIMLYLYLDPVYINVHKNYRKSFEHLKKAYELGIANQAKKEEVLYRLGRIAHEELNKIELAKYYYKKFIKEFPFTDRMPVAKSHLRELSKR